MINFVVEGRCYKKFNSKTKIDTFDPNSDILIGMTKMSLLLGFTVSL